MHNYQADKFSIFSYQFLFSLMWKKKLICFRHSFKAKENFREILTSRLWFFPNLIIRWSRRFCEGLSFLESTSLLTSLHPACLLRLQLNLKRSYPEGTLHPTPPLPSPQPTHTLDFFKSSAAAIAVTLEKPNTHQLFGPEMQQKILKACLYLYMYRYVA